MICPACGARVSDGAVTCPRCHELLGVTQKLTVSDATWCPACGALVPPGAETCPKCGSAVPGREPERPSTRRSRELDEDLPSIGNTGVMPAAEDSESTNVMTRIESAIPQADDASTPSARSDRMPRTRSFALAALLAVVVVGGGTLLITHPWDPDATSISAKTPADTSMQGFPGILESLSGQDGTGERESASEQVSRALESAYEQLGELSARVDESEDALRSDGLSASADERAEGLSGAQAIAIDISNLISDVSGTVDETSSRAEDMENLETLGNWLRNRCDALVDAWEACAESADPAADSDEILGRLDAGSAFKELFAQSYDGWAPSAD